jgi:hypothetical protein
MFEEEADTISCDVGSDTMQAVLCAAQTLRDPFLAEDDTDAVEIEQVDTIPLDLIELEDTALLLPNRRPPTDSDWPPVPKPPGARQIRRAGMYKAITRVSSLITIK